MSHGITIENNEQHAINSMKEALMKVNNRLRTKGRFQVEIPTNGLQNRMDMKWAQKANPDAHNAQIYRDLLD